MISGYNGRFTLTFNLAPEVQSLEAHRSLKSAEGVFELHPLLSAESYARFLHVLKLLCKFASLHFSSLSLIDEIKDQFL